MAKKSAVIILAAIIILGIILFFSIKTIITGKTIDNSVFSVTGQSTAIGEETTTSIKNSQSSTPTTENSKPTSRRSSSGGGGSSGGGTGGGGGDGGGGGGNNQNLIYIESKNPALNEDFNVSIKIISYVDVYALEFTLLFNSTIEALTIEEGNFLKQNSQAYPIKSINNSENKISFADTKIGTETGISGQGEIAIIKFKATNPGTSQLILKNVKIISPAMQEINFTINNKEINIAYSQGH